MRRGAKKGSVVAQLVVAVFFVGLAKLMAWDCRRKDGVREVRDRFFDPLHAGDLDAAYAELSAERRAVMSREQFEAFIRHPVFMDPNATYYPPEQDAPGWCINGYVERSDGEWAIQVFLLEEDDGLHMHSIATQPPARMQLAKLVPACGFWKGTMMGYGGPPPGPTTRTTRSRW